MKKILSLILVAVMLCTSLLLVACAGNDEDAKLKVAYEKIVNDLKFDDSACTETLVVAMSPDFAPMEFYDTSKSGDDAIVGFDVILAKYLAKEMNVKLVIKPMDFDSCLIAVQTGNADVAISGFSWTKDRAETFLISDYYVAGENETEQVVITKKGTTFASANDLNGKKVAAQGGSLQQLLVEEQLVTAGAELVQYTSTNECLAALKSGAVDAFAVANGNGEAFISQNDDIDFSGFEFVVEDKYKNNVILVNKNDADLLASINTVLAKAMSSNVYNTWYEACEVYSGISTLDEAGFDENGEKIKD